MTYYVVGSKLKLLLNEMLTKFMYWAIKISQMYSCCQNYFKQKLLQFKIVTPFLIKLLIKDKSYYSFKFIWD
jgi:hypothetical protein